MFTSMRERLLWLAALAVTAAIYSTVAVAPAASRVLRERGLTEAAFGVGVLLVAVATVWLAVAERPRLGSVGVMIGVAAVYLLVFVRIRSTEERTHLIEYTLLAALIHEALLERHRHGRPVAAPWLLAFAIAAAIGIGDELVQAALPNRVFDVRDIAFNVGAAALAIVVGVTLRWLRRRRG